MEEFLFFGGNCLDWLRYSMTIALLLHIVHLLHCIVVWQLYSTLLYDDWCVILGSILDLPTWPSDPSPLSVVILVERIVGLVMLCSYCETLLLNILGLVCVDYCPLDWLLWPCIWTHIVPFPMTRDILGPTLCIVLYCVFPVLWYIFRRSYCVPCCPAHALLLAAMICDAQTPMYWPVIDGVGELWQWPYWRVRQPSDSMTLVTWIWQHDYYYDILMTI